ncbi:MAG: OmpH family outer membrane protein [Geminicoccaceae bacterium]
MTRVLIAPAMVILCCANAFAADDQQLPTTVAAVIDYQRILLESAASKSIAEQMDIRRKAFQDEIGKEEQRLHEARKALGKQRSILSDEAFETKQGEFEKEYANVRQLASDRRKQLEAASAEAVNEVKTALIEIVTEIADERGFNLVLPSSQVLFFSRQIDLTDEVLSKLDARLSQVAVRDIVD